MGTVFITKLKDYDSEKIKIFLERFFKNLKLNDKVLIKPNLIAPKKIDKCCNTHPVFVEGIVKFVKNYTDKIYIGDSPGFGTLKLNIKVNGYEDLIKKYNVKIFNFNKKIEIENFSNKILKKFSISSALKEFDYIINVPKLKTHSMMGLTLSIKNCYGFIIGRDKIKYHLKAGKNKFLFSDLLIDIYETVKPQINVLDGICGMEGNGPTGGDPKKFHIVAVSECGYSLDRAIEKITDFGETYITVQAKKRKLFDESKLKINYVDTSFIDIRVKIKPPISKPANFRLPDFLINFFLPKPKIIKEKCKLCFTCVKNCPANAIYFKDDILKINDKKCIKCYCCHELCMHEAIKLK